MRRLLALLVVVALVGIASWFASGRSVSVELELDFGDAPPREATLVFTREDEHVERELKLVNLGARARRSLRLAKGSYTVGARLSYPVVSERTLSRSLIIDQAGRYSLTLF